MSLLRLLWLISMRAVYFVEIQASSHWMVTESGLIQPRLDSPFDMARPYDLLAFLDQEKRWDGIFDIFNELTKRQAVIDKLWSDIGKYTDVGRQISQDEDCVNAGKINEFDWHVGYLEEGSRKIHTDEFQLPNPYYGPNTDVPDCKKISSLTYSMCAFEHLESMIQRKNLSVKRESMMPELISPIMTLDQYGHWLAGILRQNTSSWLHYNMASLYWRIRGNAPKAIECSRRALHHVPREYKDVALSNLGVVLQRSGKINDALILLNAAIDHDITSSVSHFSLGNLYTIIGEFNTSIQHYGQAYKFNPKMDLVQKYKYAAMCHRKLAHRVLEIRELLNKLRVELNEYYLKESGWPRMQTEFLRTLRNAEDFEYRNIDKNNERVSTITGLDIKELRVQVEKNSLIKYFLDGFPKYNDEKLKEKGINVINTIYGLEQLVQHINKKGNIPDVLPDEEKPNDGELKDKKPDKASITSKDKRRDNKPGSRNSNGKKQKPPSVTDEELTEFETGIFKYPTTMSISRNAEEFDKDLEWPSDKLCMEMAPKFPENVEAIFPVFLPLENKGIVMRSLLSEKIGVRLADEIELPWHPPVCPIDREGAQKKNKQQNSIQVVDTGYIRSKLYEYLYDGNVDITRNLPEAEIGHRIYTAMKKKLAPKWVLLMLSSLYWRSRQHRWNALHCLLTAARWVQRKYRDVVLVSLASVYLEGGHFDDALAVAEEAFRINLYEPATNFLLAQLSMVNKHRSTHMFHLKQVVRVERDFMDGLPRNLLNGWGCILKQVNALREMEFGEGDICTNEQPLMNMVCEKDGENCQMTNIQCFNKNDRADTSALIRLLKKKEGVAVDDVDASFFDRFIASTPKERSDRLAHHAHYDNMRRTIDIVLKGCGPSGCDILKPKDLLIKEPDCNYHTLQLGYWLHIVSFRQMLADSNPNLPAEIALMTPSSNSVPECRVPLEPSQDFFVEKLLQVNPEGWEPVLSLMHQFSEMFDFYDYSGLGAKIAQYVETHSGAWAGAFAAGWWCGANGRGACALRCLTAAHALAPADRRPHTLRALAALLHLQSKQQDAKDVAYLSFYNSPKSNVEAFMVAVSHTYLREYDQATWMYRYALALEEKYLPAKACLHATMCLMFYGDGKRRDKDNRAP